MNLSRGGSADPRLDERSNVFLSATVNNASGSYAVRIRNISKTGAMLDGAELPGEGERVNLQRGSLAVDAEIAWQSGNFRGARFESAIDVDAWIRRVGHAGQQRVDKAVAALKVGLAAAAATLGEPAEAKSVEELCDDLLRVCEHMSASPDLTVEIGEDVLKVESIALSLKKLGSEHG